MDENTSPVSTPGSENSYSIRERFSPLQAKTNKSRYEIKSDGGKKSSTASSPRSPLNEKGAGIITPPFFSRQTIDKLYRRSPPPTDKQRQPKLQLHIEKKDSNDGVLQLKQQQLHKQQQQQPISSPNVHDKLQQQPISPSHTESRSPENDDDDLPILDDGEIKALQQEIGASKLTLAAERQHSEWMTSWENTMVELIDQFKELQVDIDDSVDILVESDQVLTELEVDRVANLEKQAQVDELMNLVPIKLFELEVLKAKH